MKSKPTTLKDYIIKRTLNSNEVKHKIDINWDSFFFNLGLFLIFVLWILSEAKIVVIK